MTTYTDATPPTGGARLGLAGATALTLAALAVIGWHLRTERQGTARVPATTISVDAGQPQAAQAAVQAEPAPPAAVVTQQLETRVVLVSSAAQAAALQANARDWNARRVADGLLPIDMISVVAASEAEALTVRLATEEASLRNAMEGRALVVVEDARHTDA